MKRIIVFLILFITVSSVYSQKTLWADKIIGFSSDGGIKKFSAKQILGTPSVMPYFGYSPCAWSPKLMTRKTEWIQVGFSEPIHAQQVVINENNFPGAISQVILYDSLERGIQVYSNNSVNQDEEEGKLTHIFFPMTSYRVYSVRINVSLLKYIERYQIDAVAISESADSVTIAINTPPDENEFSPEHLSDMVNTNSAELAPIISTDGKLLIFTRDTHPDNMGAEKKQDVWYAEMDADGQFTNVKNFGPPINNNGSNFAISITQDGNSLFLGNVYLPDGTMKPGFSISYKDGNNWSFPDSVKIRNYYNYSKSGSYCLAGNGKVMIFAIQREDSYGENDLYVSFLEKDGYWSVPKNLGNIINTADEEISPFLASDGVTLYFSTAGKPGYGMHDMFFSKRLDDSWTNWSEPINLGEKINSAGWDAYYTIPASGEYAYYVANFNDGRKEDIYRIKLPEKIKPQAVVMISGKVINKKNNKPLSASILYEILPEGTSAGQARSNPANGEYRIVLPAGSNYGYLAQADGFISVNENLDLSHETKYREINQNLYLVPVEKGQKLNINNIFFETNKFALLDASFLELDRIVEFLEKNSTVNIKIEGHTDNVGDEKYNKKLSLMRAGSVVNYIISKGIDKSRIVKSGAGSKSPIASNKNEKGRRQNRRVEMTIMEE